MKCCFALFSRIKSARRRKMDNWGCVSLFDRETSYTPSETEPYTGSPGRSRRFTGLSPPTDNSADGTHCGGGEEQANDDTQLPMVGELKKDIKGNVRCLGLGMFNVPRRNKVRGTARWAEAPEATSPPKKRDSAMNATERNLDILTRDMRAVVGDMEDLMKGIPDDVSEEVRQLGESVKRRLDSARESCHRLEDQTRAKLRDTDEWVHEKPYPLIGAAVAVGLVIGLLLGHR